jgi:hypothetical protein
LKNKIADQIDDKMFCTRDRKSLIQEIMIHQKLQVFGGDKMRLKMQNKLKNSQNNYRPTVEELSAAFEAKQASQTRTGANIAIAGNCMRLVVQAWQNTPPHCRQ